MLQHEYFILISSFYSQQKKDIQHDIAASLLHFVTCLLYL